MELWILFAASIIFFTIAFAFTNRNPVIIILVAIGTIYLINIISPNTFNTLLANTTTNYGISNNMDDKSYSQVFIDCLKEKCAWISIEDYSCPSGAREFCLNKTKEQ